jgi:hypothetical protein
MQLCRLQLSPIEGAVRTAGTVAGTAAILSGLKKKYSDAKAHTRALRELSNSFKSELAQQVVDAEGRRLRLTGTAGEHHCEGRKLLLELYLEENGTQAGAAALRPASPAADIGPGGAAPSLHPETASPARLDSAH